MCDFLFRQVLADLTLGLLHEAPPTDCPELGVWLPFDKFRIDGAGESISHSHQRVTALPAFYIDDVKEDRWLIRPGRSDFDSLDRCRKSVCRPTMVVGGPSDRVNLRSREHRDRSGANLASQ